jgi:hypothetical protein
MPALGPSAFRLAASWCCSRVGEGLSESSALTGCYALWVLMEDLWGVRMPFMHPESLKTFIQWTFGVVHE